MTHFTFVLRLVVAGSLLTLTACRAPERASERLAKDSAAVQQIDTNLSFNNITLEQADEQGKLLWKVKARQASYSEDKQIATVQQPDGELFQDGAAVYRVKAKTAQVQQNGKKIVLRGSVQATDLDSKAVLQGEEVEWVPEQGVLIIRRNVKGTHPQLQMAANEARLYNKDRRMELKGKVTAVTADPALQLKAEHLVWQMRQQLVLSDRPIQVTRFKGQQVADVAQGNQARVNLVTKIVTLSQNARILTARPPLQISSSVLVWNPSEETLATDQPVTVVQRQEQITLNGDRGQFNLQQQTAVLTGNVRAIAQGNRSQLTASRLNWNLSSREVVAEGNVNYRQQNPPLNVTGPRALGRLERQTIVMNGGRVVTEIVPQ